MKTNRPKGTSAKASPPLPEMSRDDRAVLADAYKSRLISGWKIDRDHGYRLTLAGRDEYVEVAKLTAYLEGLRKKLL